MSKIDKARQRCAIEGDTQEAEAELMAALDEEAKHTYIITVGETGNEIGHETRSHHKSDLCAMRAAKRRCAEYKGDGWWAVEESSGYRVASGGRRNY